MSAEQTTSTPLLDAEEAQLELLRQKVGCKYNKGVICGLNNPAKCKRCGWNPNAIKPAPAQPWLT